MGRFGDDTNPQTVDYLTLHGLKHGTQTPELSDERPYYFDSEMPFEATQPGETEHKDDYMGRIMNGPFKNFNLFMHRCNRYMVLIFGRVTPLQQDGFEHLCDKNKTWQMVKCSVCGEETSVENGEAWFDCSGCETYTQNPNFKTLDGNPEYELL